jgi:hypothetical protein
LSWKLRLNTKRLSRVQRITAATSASRFRMRSHLHKCTMNFDFDPNNSEHNTDQHAIITESQHERMTLWDKKAENQSINQSIQIFGPGSTVW